MHRSALADSLCEVAAGLLTPLDEQNTDDIRYDELASTTEWLHANGINLFLACANISEYHSLTHKERVESVRVVCDALGDDATVLGGAGGSTKSAIDLAQAHVDNGADGIMVMPPDHTFKHEAGVVRYYHRIADAVDVGVVPYIRGMEATVRMLDWITDHENVTGIKWAVPDIELFAECVEQADEDMVWICGMAEPPAPAYYLEGADGFSAGVTNFEPRLGLELFDALEAGNYERAKRLRNLSQPLMNLRAESGEDNVYASANSVPVLKRCLDLAGRYAGPVREPLVELSEADRERVDDRYEELQAGLERLDAVEPVN